MNRVIKFRGKRIANDEWAFGSLLQWPDGDCTILESKDGNNYVWKREIDPNTVGQFTGLKDKNGREIYEGDILQVLGNKITLTVVFDKVTFKFAWNDLSGEFFPAEWTSNCTIIGNIYDNFELLEEGER